MPALSASGSSSACIQSHRVTARERPVQRHPMPYPPITRQRTTAAAAATTQRPMVSIRSLVSGAGPVVSWVTGASLGSGSILALRLARGQGSGALAARVPGAGGCGMTVVGLVLIGIAAAIHLYVFVLESLRWMRPATRATFGITSERDAETTRLLAFNQGFYNLFLAIIAVGGHRARRTPACRGRGAARRQRGQHDRRRRGAARIEPAALACRPRAAAAAGSRPARARRRRAALTVRTAASARSIPTTGSRPGGSASGTIVVPARSAQAEENR